jgi:transposase
MNSGHGAISALSWATGIRRKTIRSGIADLSSLSPQIPDTGKQRRLGAGRKPLTVHSPQLAKALDALMEPYISGDPMRPLRWTCKSTQKLAAELTSQGFKIGARSISKLLKEQDYSLQSNRKRHQGSHHPDRNAQFE